MRASPLPQTHRPRRPAQEAAEVTEEIRLRPRVNARRGDQDEGHGEDRGRGSSAGDHTPRPWYASPQTLPRLSPAAGFCVFSGKNQILTNPVIGCSVGAGRCEGGAATEDPAVYFHILGNAGSVIVLPAGVIRCGDVDDERGESRLAHARTHERNLPRKSGGQPSRFL